MQIINKMFSMLELKKQKILNLCGVNRGLFKLQTTEHIVNFFFKWLTI